MKNIKRASVFLIILALLVSMFSGVSVMAAEEPAGDYTVAEAFTPGNRYIIAAEYEGEYYALACSGDLAAEKVTVSGDAVTPASDSVKWTAGDGDTMESVASPGNYIFAGSGGFMLWDSGRTFVYDSAAKQIFMHSKYYLTFDGTAFGQSDDSAAAAEIVIFEAVYEAGDSGNENIEPEGDYNAVDAFEYGNRYIIATEYEGEHYAFAFASGALAAEKVTVNGDAATPASDNVKWTARDGDAVESVSAPGTFVYAGSYGLMTYSTGRTFVYQPDSESILMHNLYYLTFDGTAFSQSKDIEEACKITIYEKVMPEIEEEEKYIPDGSDLPSVVRDSVKNPDGSITLAFVSDVHHSVDYDQNNLQVWLGNMKQNIGYIDAMGFCGDMGSAYSSTAAEYWENTQAVIDYMDTEVEAGFVGTTVYTYGNHEWYPSAGGDYMNNYENNPTADRLLRVGEGLKTDDYIFYCLGSGSMSAQMRQGYSEEDINRIDTYLATAPTDIPIFVLTHFPIHFWSDRLTSNADKLAAVLNKYPNVVVIWGHNHSDFDEAYDAICRPGDILTIDSAGTQVEINFTYLSAGCISDAEYTGISGGSAWVLGKGIIITIGADGTLSYDYYTMDAQKMAEEGPYLVEYRDNLSYETIYSEFIEPGAAAVPPQMPDVINYKFDGWDADLSSINRHTVATAQYEYTTGLDENYVYFTVLDDDSVAIGKTGKPIVHYAIPFTEGMTSVDALKTLQDAEYEGGGADVASGGYGYIANIWGHVPTNGSWVMDPGSSTGYISATAELEGGRCYYIYALDGTDFKETSYLSPFASTAYVNDTVSMYTESWVFDFNTYGYNATPLNGDVYIGTAIDALEDSGIDAVDGEFDISFDTIGTYYIGVVSPNAGIAITTITVKNRVIFFPPGSGGSSGGSSTPAEPEEPEKPEEPEEPVEDPFEISDNPVVVVSPQTITFNGAEISIDAYNIDGHNFFKLRDLAYTLLNTSAGFGVAYDAESNTVIVTTGAVYAPDGTEMQIGKDNSATAVASPQAIYIDGDLADVVGFNIGGNNYYRIADLADLLGFGLSYDEATNTVLITA